MCKLSVKSLDTDEKHRLNSSDSIASCANWNIEIK